MCFRQFLNIFGITRNLSTIHDPDIKKTAGAYADCLSIGPEFILRSSTTTENGSMQSTMSLPPRIVVRGKLQRQSSQPASTFYGYGHICSSSHPSAKRTKSLRLTDLASGDSSLYRLATEGTGIYNWPSPGVSSVRYAISAGVSALW